MSLINIGGKRIIFGGCGASLKMKAGDIMVTEVVTLRPEDTVLDAATKFARHRVSGCPVVDENNTVVGMLSEADILGHLKTEYKRLKMRFPPEVMFGITFEEEVMDKEIDKAFGEIGNVKVEELMRHTVTVATTDDSIESIVRLMVKNKVNRVPIVENGQLVGIVTRGDVIGGIYKN